MPKALASSTVALVVAFLLGGVILAFYALGLAIVGERVAPANLAAANTAFIVTYQGGGLLGPVAAGIAMTNSPVNGFVATMVVLMIVSGLALLTFERFGTAKR
jgi:MFS family permease